jgi:UrcA family protein
MSGATTTRILRGSLISVVAALGLSFTAAHAQPYYDQYPDTYAPSPDTYTTADGVTVYAHPYRSERAPNGAPIETVQASRFVNVSDLDLDTGYGRHILRERVERAASDACRELDTLPGYVPDVHENDVDCQRRAVSDALAAAPVSRDVDYYGY